jgi:hypothetical protein
MCLTGAKGPGFSASHMEVSLEYFSTFEPIDLTPDSIMQLAGVPILYDSASHLRRIPRLPCLCFCPFANVLGLRPSFRVSLAATVITRFRRLVTLVSATAECTRTWATLPQQQQGIRGKHLDVALRPGPPQDGVHCKG